MAATVTEIGNSTVSANPASAPSATTTASVAVGEVLFAIVVVQATATLIPTATCSAGGNAMTQDDTANRGAGASNPVVFCYRFEPGSTLASGSAVTATVTNAGAGSIVSLLKVTGLATGVGLDATAATNNGLSQTPTSGATGTPPVGDEVFSLAVLSANFNATGGTTVGGSYTALTDLSQTVRAITLYTAWKDIPAAAAAQNVSWTPTWGANKAWAGMAMLYRVSSAGAAGGSRPRIVVSNEAQRRSSRW